MLQLKDIKKDYQTSGNTVHALRGVTLRFRQNEFVSILGASGCGKTTLLNIIGGLDHYTSGDLVISGVSTKDYKDRDWDVYRNHRIGFVFQSYNLIPHQTVLTNVELALTIAGVSKIERKRRAKQALERVGLGSELHKRPNQLSGGQMQRVAIARALVNNPEILLADEPTGALDSATSEQIMELIREIAGERLVIMVTHNPEIAEAYSTRIVRLQDGLVIADSNPYEGEEAEKEKQANEQVQLQTFTALCPTCKKPLLFRDVDARKPKKYICPFCYAHFALRLPAEQTETVQDTENEQPQEQLPVSKKEAKKAKKAEKKAKKAEKKAEKKAKKAEKRSKKKNRTSMSYATSLGLSARNLATKKGRTMITSIAGSIGIISVCLVLALSNGFNAYIKQTQEDMLSSYPLEITETTMDLTSIMTGMTSLDDMPDLKEIGDKVYVNSFLTNIAQGMTVTNDLSKEYISYLESMDDDLYAAIQYDNGIDLNYTLFTEVEMDRGGVTKKTAMSIAALKTAYTQKLSEQEEKYAQLAPLVEYLGAIYGKMPGTSDFNASSYGKYVLSQYEVVGDGHFPQNINEVALVVGNHNDVTDLTLAQLGLISEEQFMSFFPMPGEIVDEDKEDTFIHFDNVVGKKFMLNYNDAVFTESTGQEYLFDYTGERDTLDSSDASKGIEIEISCVLRLKEGLNYGCLSSGLFFTEKLYTEYQTVNQESKIVKAVEKQSQVSQQAMSLWEELSSLSPTDPAYREKMMQLMQLLQYFKRAAQPLEEYYMAASSIPGMGGGSTTNSAYVLYGDTALRVLGGKANPNAIYIYTDSFEAKEGVIQHLDAWNDSHEKAEQVRYTDAVGIMMSMVETILNAITYVLVAFTAISLVVSSVMIGIITYVSVVERTKEIGVLRSLGARKKDIRNLFNAETFIIGLTSGVFGVCVTYAIAFGVNALLSVLTGIATLASLPITSAIIMIIVSITLTLISGLIPAKAAANKDPVLALRTE